MTAILLARALAVPPIPGRSAAALAGPVDVSLNAGEVLALLGPSGAGKTTLLRCLALLEPRSEGTVLFAGEEVPPAATPSFRREVLYLPQQPPSVPMKVAEALSEPFLFKSAKGARFEVEEAIRLCLGLRLPDDVLDRWVPDLSVGEAQRVALARALMIRPAVLLLDEFSSAMDPSAVVQAEGLLRDWLGQGERAAVLVSHDPAQIERLATASLSLENGRPETGATARPKDAADPTEGAAR